METILCLTDLSDISNHATWYGYEMAKKLETNIIICSVINIPAEIPQYEVVMWPLKNFSHFENDNRKSLNRLKKSLEDTDQINGYNGYHPAIDCICETGTVANVVAEIFHDKKISIVVMGTHAHNRLKHLLFGNHVRYLIDASAVPLLLIPPEINNNQINWIGFATNLDPKDFLQVVKLIELAKGLDAEIILFHINNKGTDKEAMVKQQLEDFTSAIRNKYNYTKTSYQYTNGSSVIAGLKKICIKNGDNGLLTLLHRNIRLINEILKGSYTQKMAKRLVFPLLVLQ